MNPMLQQLMQMFSQSQGAPGAGGAPAASPMPTQMPQQRAPMPMGGGMPNRPQMAPMGGGMPNRPAMMPSMVGRGGMGGGGMPGGAAMRGMPNRPMSMGEQMVGWGGGRPPPALDPNLNKSLRGGGMPGGAAGGAMGGGDLMQRVQQMLAQLKGGSGTGRQIGDSVGSMAAGFPGAQDPGAGAPNVTNMAKSPDQMMWVQELMKKLQPPKTPSAPAQPPAGAWPGMPFNPNQFFGQGRPDI